MENKDKGTSDSTAVLIAIGVIILIILGIVGVGYLIGYVLDIYDSAGWWGVICFVVGAAVFAYIKNK